MQNPIPKVSLNAQKRRNTLEMATSEEVASQRRQKVMLSYQYALSPKQQSRLAVFPWVTWCLFVFTLTLWSITAYQVALKAGAHTWRAILATVLALDEDANVLISFGAKYNPAILHGQYWRFVTAIFLHATALHVGINMLNFLVLGLIIERIFGHLRFILIYLLTGIFSILASFVFAPQEVSVGASGAIFGLVGAYSAFILLHRQAFRYQGITALIWLVVVIGVNLGLGFVISNVDNYAHVGGLLSGCLLGWLFTPFYTVPPSGNTPYGRAALIDAHSLTRRWPLVLFLIVFTFVSALIAIHLVGG